MSLSSTQTTARGHVSINALLVDDGSNHLDVSFYLMLFDKASVCHPLHSVLGQAADPRCVAAPGLFIPGCSLPGSVRGKSSS